MALQFTEHPDKRRKKLLRITPGVLVSLFKQDRAWRCMAGLPSDSEVIATQYEFSTNEILMVVISNTFEIVPDSQVLKAIDSPTFTILDT